MSREGWREGRAPADAPGEVLRAVEPFDGLKVTVLAGDGERSPLREVVHVFDEDGSRLAVVDPFDRAQEVLIERYRKALEAVAQLDSRAPGASDMAKIARGGLHR